MTRTPARPRRPLRAGALVTALAAVAALVTLAGPAADARTRPATSESTAHVSGHVSAQTAGAAVLRHACAPARPGRATCFAAYWAVRSGSAPGYGNQPGHMTGLTAKDIAAAYRLPTSGKHPLVAIVDAQNDPKAEADLAVFRAHNHLPACTTGNGCFTRVNQNGESTPLPFGDPGWGLEISLDLDAVSASCPNCRILLVEAREPSLVALGTAVDTAVRLGASVVSNSYGTPEYNGTLAAAHRYYEHPGVAIVASSGDESFGVPSDPAVDRDVIAVGGTRLIRTSRTARGWAEEAWSGAGSGCSAYVPKPSWQHDTHCPMRVTSDVAAVAAPGTGLQVYDTYGLGPYNGYVRVGGTSLSAPLVAGMIALAGNAASLSDAQYVYDHRSALNDVTTGSNGYCGGDYLCTGRPGYDGPTGLGTPNGLGAL